MPAPNPRRPFGFYDIDAAFYETATVPTRGPYVGSGTPDFLDIDSTPEGTPLATATPGAWARGMSAAEQLQALKRSRVDLSGLTIRPRSALADVPREWLIVGALVLLLVVLKR